MTLCVLIVVVVVLYDRKLARLATRDGSAAVYRHWSLARRTACSGFANANACSLEQFGALFCSRLGVRAEWISYPLSCPPKAHFPLILDHVVFTIHPSHATWPYIFLVFIVTLCLMLCRPPTLARPGRYRCSAKMLLEKMPSRQHVLSRRTKISLCVPWCYPKHDQSAEIRVLARLGNELHWRILSRVGIRYHAISSWRRSWQWAQWCL